MYHCKECISFDFCFRCMMDRDTIHPKDHDFVVSPSLDCPETPQNLAAVVLIICLPIRQTFATRHRPRSRPRTNQGRILLVERMIYRKRTQMTLSKGKNPVCDWEKVVPKAGCKMLRNLYRITCVRTCFLTMGRHSSSTITLYHYR